MRHVSHKDGGFYTFRTAEGFEKCSQNEGRVGYLPLKSNISNWSNTAYLKTKVDNYVITSKHCQILTLRKGHGAGVTVGKCMRMEIFFFFFFFAIWSRIFLFSLSLSLLFLGLFLRVSYAGPFPPRLIGVDGAALRRYNGKTNIFGSKIWPSFSYFGSLYMLVSSCLYYYYPAYYRSKWYWNWKTACINLTVRVVQKVLDSIYA